MRRMGSYQSPLGKKYRIFLQKYTLHRILFQGAFHKIMCRLLKPYLFLMVGGKDGDKRHHGFRKILWLSRTFLWLEMHLLRGHC